MKFRWPWSRSNKQVSIVNQKRAYSAAAYNRLVSDWVTSSSSADAEMRGPLKVLRNRSRDLGRNNDYVRQFLREVQNNVIGMNGIPFQAQVRKERGQELNKDINDAIEDLWYRWTRKEYCHVAAKLGFIDIERLIIREIAESGEVFVRKVRRKFRGSKVALSLEIIESDRVDDDFNGIAENGNEVVMGIEKDQWGAPTAYYIKPYHPGDNSPSRVNGTSRSNIRVPAEEIIHLGLIERWPQTRSVPWIASSIMRLHQMGGYEEAEVISARATASLMGFIQSPEGETRGEGVQNDQRVTQFEPGVYKYLGPGETVNVPNLNRPSGQLDPFMSFMLRGVAAGCGASYETISKDFSKSTYSSSRSSLLSERDMWRAIQGWLVRNFHQPIFEEFLDMASLSGAISLKGYELNPERFQSVKWMPRGWAWVDPAKEVAAYKEAVRGGLKTLSEISAEEGKDFEEQVDQRKREVDLINKKGLVFDTDASVNRYGQGNTNSNPKNNSQDGNTDDA